jgi:hypothetical protein
MIEIMKNATIVYIDGVIERFDAILMTDKKVITGRIFEIEGREEFKECGFISRENIKHIYNGSKKRIQRMMA